MATISSLILDSDQAENANSLNSTDANITNIDFIEPNDTNSQDLLAEVQAIQDAIANNEDFDFTSLEATAAGPTDAGASSDKSVTSTPILLAEESLLIQYRSDQTNEEAVNTLNLQNANSNVSSEAENDSSFIGEAIESEATQIQSSLNEDSVTQTQGTFETGTNINPQTIETQYGRFVSHDDGTWDYSLNNQAVVIQSLSAGNSVEDTINLEDTTGNKVELAFTINGKNDQAVITGQKQASIDASPLSDITNDNPVITGQLNVSDVDAGEARFATNFNIEGSFGTAQINALGEWSYTLNNSSEAVLGLHSGDRIFDLFSVKTLDGTKQLIQVSIQGADDKPLLSGKNTAVLDLETDLNTEGSLIVNDPDFGESAFQALSDIQSSLGYGTAEIDSQGNWSFTLNDEFTALNSIDEGLTRIDSFDVFTLDGTSQTILIPIEGSDNPLYAQTSNGNSEGLAFNDLLTETEQQDSLSNLLSEQVEQHNSQASPQSSGENLQAEVSIYMNADSSSFGPSLNQNLSDIPIS